ncbi:hypothetical protein IPD43_28340, partial [Paenibacillus polymyxa]|nr:hypothetical protein [Paenibacillus polymyxa]
DSAKSAAQSGDIPAASSAAAESKSHASQASIAADLASSLAVVHDKDAKSYAANAVKSASLASSSADVATAVGSQYPDDPTISRASSVAQQAAKDASLAADAAEDAAA